MQETAKQAGDVISVTDSETQSSIGFVRWGNQLQTSLGKLRIRSSKAKAFSSNPRLIPLSKEKAAIPVPFLRALSFIGKGKEPESNIVSSSTGMPPKYPLLFVLLTITKEETVHISEVAPQQLSNRPSIGMRRKVMDALIRSRNASQGDITPASFPVGAANLRDRPRRGPKDRQEEFTLQSAGPSHDVRHFDDVDQRVVVSEGESFIGQDDADTDGSGYTSSSDDYGETDGDREQRFFVGAGGVRRTQSDHTHPSHTEDHDHEDEFSAENEGEDQDLIRNRGPSVYSGSDSSESAPPVEIRRRRPTVSSSREAQNT
jgi:hypothetical protein